MSRYSLLVLLFLLWIITACLCPARADSSANLPIKTISTDIGYDESILSPLKKYILKSYANIGQRITIIEVAAGRSVKMAENGQIDAVLIKTDEILTRINDLVKVPVLLLEGEFVLYCQANVDCSSDVFNDAEVFIGVVGGVNLTTTFLETKRASMYQVTQTNQLANMLSRNRINYFLSFELNGTPLFDFKLPQDVQKLVIKRVKGFHAIHKKQSAMLPAITESLSQSIEQLGPIEESVLAYFKDKHQAN